MFLGLVGGLVVLCVAGLVFFLLIGRNRAQLLYDTANEAMQGNQFAQALSDFDRYLEAYPSHEAVPLARVQRGLCAIYRYTEGSSPSWTNGLREAEDVVSQVGSISQFEPHRREFGDVMGRIAMGLAEASRAKVDPEAARGARKALALLKDNVPEEMRPPDVIAQTEQVLAEAEQSLERDTAYSDALAKMTEDLASGDFLAVYRRHRALIRQWPTLAGKAEVAALIEQAQQKEREAVTFVASTTAAEHTPRPQSHEAAVALARWVRRSDAEGASGAPAREAVVYAQVADAVYGVRALTGEVLWRRVVGYDQPFLPLSVMAQGRPATLLGDTAHGELLLVEQETQSLVWRQAFDEAFAGAPRVARNRIYQSLSSGRLLEIDLATGRIEGEFRFPQPVHSTPLTDSTGLFLSIPADRDTLYLVSLTDRRCVASLYVGHDEGSLSSPMASAGPYQLLFENDRADSCQLRVIVARGTDATLQLVQTHRLAGWVHHPPVVRENRLFATTDRGRLYGFSLAARETDEPLRLDAQTGDSTSDGGQPFVVPRNNREVWLLGSKLDGWVLNEPQQRFEGMRRGGSADATAAGTLGAFVFSSWQPIQTAGDDAFLVTRSADRPGTLVTAVSLKDDQIRWQVVLAAGLADLTASEGDSVLIALTGAGDLFRVEAGGRSGGTIVQEPLSSLAVRYGLEGEAWRADIAPTQRLYWSPRAPRDLLIREGTAAGQTMAMARRTLPFDLSAAPALFRGGILAPGPDGNLASLGWPGLAPSAEAFQAPFEVARPPRWRSVAVAPDGSILAADLNGVLYRVEWVGEPVARLQGEAVQTLPGPLRSRVAIAGNAAYVIDATQTLWAFSLDGRNELGRWNLADGLAGDLMVVGEVVLVHGPSGVLRCFDGAGREAWSATLPEGALAGAPRALGNHVLVAGVRGEVWALQLADGSKSWSVDTGQALESGPVIMAGRFAVGAVDGAVLLYPLPR
jgi:outer membrane protein assembly factor BamB